MNAAMKMSQKPAYVIDQPKSLLQRFLQALGGHVGLLMCISVFASVGAYIFISIETPAEEYRFLVKRLRAKDIEDTMSYISNLFWFEKHQNVTERQWQKKMLSTLKVMETQIISAVTEHHYDGHEQTWVYEWTFPKALLFTSSIMTTLGYGHIAPVTSNGQVFTICYAMVGIPLMLVFLARIGDVMASGFRRVYRDRRYQSEALFGRKAKRTWEDEVGLEEYMPTRKVRVPMAVLLVVMLIYLLLGANIFSSWEGWTFVTACYFSFVTLSTIGFGDFVPGNSFFGDKEDIESAWKMGAAIVYCLFGMALVSMCIQMVQQQVLDKVRWLGEELGLVQDHLRPRLQYRRSAPGTVPATKCPLRARSSAIEEVQLLDGESSRKTSRRRKKGSRSGRAEGTRRRRKMLAETGEGVPADDSIPTPADADECEKKEGGDPTATPTEADMCGGKEGEEIEVEAEEKAGQKEDNGGSKSVLPNSPENNEAEEEKEGGEMLIEEEMDLEKGLREDGGR